MDYLKIQAAIEKESIKLLESAVSAALPGIANAVEAGIADNFIERGRWAGSGSITILAGGSAKWVPLAASTKAAYKKKGWVEQPTLSRTGGGLAASIEVSPNGTSLGLTMSANKEYAAIHQFGGQAGKNLSVTIPARPFLIINDDVFDEIKEEIKAAVRESV